MGKIVKYVFYIFIFGLIVQIITGDSTSQSDKEYAVKSDNVNIIKQGYHKSDSGNRWVLFTYNKNVTELDIFNFAQKQASSYGGNSTLYFYKDDVIFPWTGNVTEALSMEQARKRLTSKASGVWDYFYRDLGFKTEFQSCINIVNLYCKGRFKEQRKRMRDANIKEISLVDYFKSDKAKLYGGNTIN